VLSDRHAALTGSGTIKERDEIRAERDDLKHKLTETEDDLAAARQAGKQVLYVRGALAGVSDLVRYLRWLCGASSRVSDWSASSSAVARPVFWPAEYQDWTALSQAPSRTVQ